MTDSTQHSKSILFFFGSDVDLMHLDVVLQTHGLNVSVVRAVDEALARLDEQMFNLIIIQDFSDAYMLRAIKKLREALSEKQRDTPIAVVSYNADKTNFSQQVLKAGGNFVYSRQNSLLELIPKIDALLQT
ncbi:MAG: hypothetical protein RLP44_25515 [Aggregatilineales bacterium]